GRSPVSPEVGLWIYTCRSAIAISEVVFVLGRLALSHPLGAARSLEYFAVRVLVGIGDRLEGAIETENPEHRHICADRHSEFSQFQSVQRVAIDTGLCSGFGNCPTAPFPSNADAFGEPLDLLGDLGW